MSLIIALQGTPGVFDPRNPTLVPNTDVPVFTGASLDHESPAVFLTNNPRVAATGTATIGGTVTTNDELTIEVTNTVFGSANPLVATYKTVGGDTTSTIATAIANLFNGNQTFVQYGLECSVAANVITFNHGGPVGNFTTLSLVSEPDSITITGTATANDVMYANFTGPYAPGGVLVSQSVTGGWTTTQMATALAAAITANATLSAAGITATAATNVVTLTVPVSQEPTVVTSYALPATETATITGTVAQGDVLTLTFTNSNLTGSPVTVSYTAPLAATTTTLATGLAAAINANTNLVAFGLSATSTTNVVTIAFPNTKGAITFAQSVTTGSETITLSGNATEVLTFGTKATETVTFSNSGTLTGGSGPVVAINNFTFTYNNNTMAFFYGRPYTLGYNLVQALVSGGMAIV
jgi:hypothetical protein